MARQVCKRWNNVIISWNGFLNSVVMVIATKDDGRKPASFSALKTSPVPWKYYQLQNLAYRIALSGIWNYSSSKPESKPKDEFVTGIEIIGGKIYWSELQLFLNKFPHLEELSITDLTIRFKKRDGWLQDKYEVETFTEFQSRVKVLKFKVDHPDDIVFYLKKFRGNQSF